jgi:hypothetical protein
MRRPRPFLPRIPLLLALLLGPGLAGSASLRALDGELDPDWSGDGLLSYFLSFAPRAWAVPESQTPHFTGRQLSDDSELIMIHDTGSGGGSWYACGGGISLLDHFEILETLIDSSGRVLLAGSMTVFGTETVERAFVARFTSAESCNFDSNFSGAGWEYFDDAPFCDIEDCRLIDIDESRDATTRYVALLESVQNSLLSDYYMVGLTASGDPDPNFGNGGFWRLQAVNFGVSAGGGAELVVDAANRIYVLHSYFDSDASFDMDTGLTRFLSNGHLDVSFQSAGTCFAAVADADDTVPRALAIGSDGRLAFGIFNEIGNEGTLIGLHPSTSQLLNMTQSPLEPRALAFDGLGRLLYAYDFPSGDGMGVNRFLALFDQGFWSGDPAFDSLYLDIDEGTTHGEFPVDIETPAGRPMVLVDSDRDGGGRQPFLVRLQNDLIFADGFEWGSAKFW